MRVALIISLVIALAAVVFAMQNPGPMEINIPFTGSKLISTQPVVLISTLLIGLLIGVLASIPGRIGAGLRARKAEKRLAEIEQGRVEARNTVSEGRGETGEARTGAQGSFDAAETQRLADEVAQRTADEVARRSDLPSNDAT